MLLLDQRHGLLRADAQLLPEGMPRFECFGRDGIVFTLQPRPWSQGAAVPAPHRRTLAELQAWPEVTMISGNAIRVQATQQSRLRWWEALDSTPLAPWRVPR